MAYNKKHAELGESVIDYVNNREDAIEASFNDVDNGLSGVSQELNDFKTDVADYVIETGSNANGSYEKWASGKLVQWQRISVPSQTSLAWGSLHYLKIPNWAYPLPFISPPLVSGSNETLFGFFGQNKATPTILDTPMWIMAEGFTSAVVMNLKAEGRWKQKGNHTTLNERKEAIGKEIKMIEDIEVYLESLENNGEGEMGK